MAERTARMPEKRMPRTEAGRAAQTARRRRRTTVAVATLAVLVVVAAGVLLAGRTSGPTAASPAQTAPASEPTAAIVPSATIEPTAVPMPSGPATITIAAVGDIHFDRRVKQLIAAKGGAEPLEDVAAQLAAADIAVGNLESPLSTRGTKNETKDYTFRGDPRGAEGLALAGFDFLALGNNHVLDYGPDALADTIDLLDEKQIGHSGAGMDKAQAWTPAVRDIDGTTVAFLSFSHILPPGFIATGSKAGLAQGRNNMDAVEEAIRTAKAEYDYVLVSFHWGVENEDDANGDQVTDAHRAIDAGADMVLSHHPHVIQAVEYYKGKFIAYSLGDFVFDHYSRKTGEAFVLEAELGPNGVANVTATPVYLDENGKPEYVKGAEARTILERLKAISAKRKTTVTLDGDIARVAP